MKTRSGVSLAFTAAVTGAASWRLIEQQRYFELAAVLTMAFGVLVFIISDDAITGQQ